MHDTVMHHLRVMGDQRISRSCPSHARILTARVKRSARSGSRRRASSVLLC